MEELLQIFNENFLSFFINNLTLTDIKKHAYKTFFYNMGETKIIPFLQKNKAFNYHQVYRELTKLLKRTAKLTYNKH